MLITSTEYSCFFNFGNDVPLSNFSYFIYSLLSASIGFPSLSSTFFFNLLISFFHWVNFGSFSNEKSTTSTASKRNAKLFSCNSISESQCWSAWSSTRLDLDTVFEDLSCFKSLTSRLGVFFFLIVKVYRFLLREYY